jgi:hypothetical protein
VSDDAGRILAALGRLEQGQAKLGGGLAAEIEAFRQEAVAKLSASRHCPRTPKP